MCSIWCARLVCSILPLPGCSLQPIARLLKTRNEHATIDRLFDSQHVQDIQVIIAISCIAFLLIGGAGAGAAVLKVWQGDWKWHNAAANCVKYGAPLFVFFGGVVSWAYKTGSLRLGVATGHSMNGKTHLHGIQQFASEEDYFPVFSGNNQSLQSLEASVVIDITAFYTFMKSFRDSLRVLAHMGASIAEADDESAITAWRTAAGNSVYMLFLGLESGRKPFTGWWSSGRNKPKTPSWLC